MNNLIQKLVSLSMVQVLVIAIGISGFYYMTSFDDGSGIRAQIHGLDEEITQEEAKKKDTDANLKEEARMKEMIGLLSQQYRDVSRRLPTSLSSIELNRHFDGFARNSGVSVKARKPLPNVRGEIVEQIPVQLSLEGTYAELAQFIYQVSISEQVVGVQEFTLTPVDKTPRLRFEGTVTGYQLSPEKAKETSPTGVDADAAAPAGGDQ